jgi:hypothetical protein
MAKVETFGSFIMQEHARLQKARDQALQKQADVDRELQEIESELAAIAAYEQAKGGKPGRAGSVHRPSEPLPRGHEGARSAKPSWVSSSSTPTASRAARS